MWIAETIDLDDHDSVVRFMKKQSDKIKELEKENEELKHSIKCLEADKMELQQYIKRMQGDD